MLLLHEFFEILPKQTKTNICFDVELPMDFERLEIDTSYAPKWVTDQETVRKLTLEGSLKYGLLPEGTKFICDCDCPKIANMVTLSLDINGSFCGYAHRHDPKQHIFISEKEATPGFHRMRPEKGVLHVVLPVNLVATELCTYELTINGIESAAS